MQFSSQVSMLFLNRIQCVLFLFVCLITYSNALTQDWLIDVPWSAPLEVSLNGKKELIPQIIGQDYDFNRINFSGRKKVENGSDFSVSILGVEKSLASNADMSYIQRHKIEVPGNVEFEGKTVRAGKDTYVVYSCFPYIYKDGQLYRIDKFSIHLSNQSLSSFQLKGKSFVTNSVLASGMWYKISITQSGVYKIDKAFLEQCGINVNGLNPNSIHIYGNGEGKLPEANSVNRTDDLAKIDVFVMGDSDGSFDDGDYLLFYGVGPSKWSVNGVGQFYENHNIYSDVSNYFIQVDASIIPARMTNQVLSSAPENTIVTDYNYFSTIENDLRSLAAGGQRWYGEVFDTELSYEFPFSIPNINSGFPVKFEVSMAANATSSSGNSQVYSVAGNQLYSATLPLSSSEYGRTVVNFDYPSPSSSFNLKIQVNRASPSIVSYLDKITMNARRNLVYVSNQFAFRDHLSVGAGNVSKFVISNCPSSTVVWEVTNRFSPKFIQGDLSSGNFEFKLETDSLREFVAYNNTQFFTPSFVQTVVNQNLHGLSQADYLIISHETFLSQANRLADLHRSNGLIVHVVTPNQIYNEFSSGMLDPSAIRFFVKMFYDRSIASPGIAPKYVLLFGDGTYDPKNRLLNNNNFVPTYQFVQSEDHISCMVSDDYYGILDDNESMSQNDMLDVGVGRLLISSLEEAKQQVDKIEHYMKNGSDLFSSSSCQASQEKKNTFGNWRVHYTQVADDEENGYFIQFDTEPSYNYVTANHHEMNCEKLYLDAYTQVSGAGGQRYPDVFNGISREIERGTLLFNYDGHGGREGVAEERVITIDQINSWRNIDNLCLFMSATCEFTRFDDPSLISAGEYVSMNTLGGAIAMMTTTRSVYFNVNTSTSNEFYKNVFKKDVDNRGLPFGEIIRLTKNASSGGQNKRSFTLIGDPALRIALPKEKAVIDTINGYLPSLYKDTLKALSKVVLKGRVLDGSNTLISDFNGKVSCIVYDKTKTYSTLAQDDDSPEIEFEMQKNALYKGKATVKNGYFELAFIVPKDIDYSYGSGKISLYVENGIYDGMGVDTNFFVGGIDPNGIDDIEGPEIEIYFNDVNFANGGITNQNPILKAKFSDENGINAIGNGIGHDIVAVLDNDEANPIVLNDYYEADLDSYQTGTLFYELNDLTPGPHTLKVVAWDVNNNSSQKLIDFTVQINGEVVLEHVLNYPNPFTTNTEFFFEHNQVCTEMDVQIQILTVSGRLVKTISETVMTEGFRSEGIPWDGRDDFGDQLAKGVYVYRLMVRMPNGEIVEKMEKLVLLK
jgi:hypothetical protein